MILTSFSRISKRKNISPILFLSLFYNQSHRRKNKTTRVTNIYPEHQAVTGPNRKDGSQTKSSTEGPNRKDGSQTKGPTTGPNKKDGSTGIRPRCSTSALPFIVLEILTGTIRQEIQFN